MECVILSGLQASGKSTFLCRTSFTRIFRINLDMLNTRNREAKLVDAWLDSKTKFVVDNTNVTRADRARYIKKAKEAHFTVLCYYMDASVIDCVARNTVRGEKVPTVAIHKTKNRLEIPRLDEGFDQLFFVKNTDEGFVITEIQPGND
jgi:predicted kinase